MFKKILVALDGSDTADLALKEAIILAKENGSIVRGIYAVDLHMTPDGSEYFTAKEIVDSMRKEGKEILMAAQKKMDSAGIQSETKLIKITQTSQRISDVIAKEAQKWPADLIVVGTHGRRGFSHFLLGSVAESIVRVATKPVLLIRGK